jgi:Leucine-rich repeat (LRR) protein
VQFTKTYKYKHIAHLPYIFKRVLGRSINERITGLIIDKSIDLQNLYNIRNILVKCNDDFTVPNGINRAIFDKGFTGNVTIQNNVRKVIFPRDYSHVVTIPPTLVLMDLGSHAIPVFTDNAVKFGQNLKTLKISITHISFVPSSVTDLTLYDDSDIDTGEYTSLCNLVNIEKLVIINNAIFDLGDVLCNLKNLRKLYISRYYNRIRLPENLKSLTIRNVFNQIMEFPKSLTFLWLPLRYKHPIGVLPNLKYLHIKKCDSIPVGINKLLCCRLTGGMGAYGAITHLYLMGTFNSVIVEYPPNLTYLHFGYEYDKPTHNLPPKLTYLMLGSCFNSAITLPDSIITVVFGMRFNQPVLLPNGVQTVRFRAGFDQLVDFPDSITELKLGVQAYTETKFPPNLKKLVISCGFKGDLPKATSIYVYGSMSRNLTWFGDTLTTTSNDPILPYLSKLWMCFKVKCIKWGKTKYKFFHNQDIRTIK